MSYNEHLEAEVMPVRMNEPFFYSYDQTGLYKGVVNIYVPSGGAWLLRLWFTDSETQYDPVSVVGPDQISFKERMIVTDSDGNASITIEHHGEIQQYFLRIALLGKIAVSSRVRPHHATLAVSINDFPETTDTDEFDYEPENVVVELDGEVLDNSLLDSAVWSSTGVATLVFTNPPALPGTHVASTWLPGGTGIARLTVGYLGLEAYDEQQVQRV